MANNYVLMSMELFAQTNEEFAWIRAQYARLQGLCDDPGATEALETRGYSTSSNDGPGFDLRPYPEDLSFVLYAEEFANVENVAAFLHEYLTRWRPDGCLCFEWATTCSKPRPGEFGGGACFVTATGAEWLSSSVWTSERLAAWRAEREEGEAPR